ncbi:hypothetical protein DAPPUDRAFT_261045 [Daphnia pulex]|uniref:Ras-GAP domain-containing protein n=1 Tax=Daphnia pulex TaxID=6669 RepID=E9HKF8_DAPPU|nr:hypothetical protein DAPPUDRAFT_261045 [Daphnia pulex]|eukprot:EFX67791.1 hypothetical protein DAPPUDRAFT_261045 [Daphnia pulex]
MHLIELGYHKDLTRAAFIIEILTQIFQQGKEFDTPAETVLATRFEQLVQLVTMIGDKGELPIAMALASVVVTPQIVMAFCFKIYGASYLHNLLQPLLKPLLENPSMSFEVDPARIDTKDYINENRNNVVTFQQNFATMC